MPHTPLSSSWSLTLYRGGSPQSAPLATLLKSAHNPLTKDDIAITFVDPQYNGFKTVLTKTSVISKAHEWSNVRGERRKWKGEGMLSSGLMVRGCAG